MSDKILVADGTETARRSQQKLLEANGYEVEVAADGFEALEKVRGFRPDLVILDMAMPRMDGIECCRRIRAMDAARDMKIVVLGPHADYRKIREAFAAGCDDYLPTPVDRSEILLKTRDLLKFSQLGRSLRSG